MTAKFDYYIYVPSQLDYSTIAGQDQFQDSKMGADDH